MADGFDHAVLGQTPPCTFYEQCDPQFGHERCGRSRREECVPHCSESWRRALQWEQWAVVRLMWKELLRAQGCLPVKLERAIGCMRLIAGRTARPSLSISITCERCLHRWLLSCSVAALHGPGCSPEMRKSRSSKAERTVSWHGLAWRAGAAEQNRNARRVFDQLLRPLVRLAM